MKKMFLFVSLMTSMAVYAGGMKVIPVQLLAIENQGRVVFIKNALNETGLSAENVKYSDFKTIVIGGDEKGSDYLGGYFIFEVQLSTENGKDHKCYQFLSVGNLDPNLTRAIVCEVIQL